MEQLETFFYIELDDNHMLAQIYCTDSYSISNITNVDFDEELFIEFLEKNQIFFGIDREKIQRITSHKIKKEEFPITIATGKPAINGRDGKIIYELNISSKIERTSDWNFRDVMRIPSVQAGQKIITLSKPTKGESGINVHGEEVPSHPGKVVTLSPGKNVKFNEENMAFYATANGQISVKGHYIHIYPVYEVKKTLSMKEGNLNFTGNIIIHGDVPTGYVVKAEGDIKVFGIVEGANLISSGSIYISKGIAGQNKGFIKANENITTGYINQGCIYAGRDLFVEGSIIHSECVVENQLFSQKGSIIGGILSSGASVEVRDVGNTINVRTEISFGIHQSIFEKEKGLLKKKRELLETLKKLSLLEEKLAEQKTNNSPKERITLLRIKNSFQKTQEQINQVNNLLDNLNAQIGNMNQTKLVVRNNIYENVVLTFGKYKRTTDRNNHYVQFRLIKNEIVMEPIIE